MLAEFDPARPGKAFYDLGPLVGQLDGVSGDVLCCINNGQGPSVLLFGGVHGDEYEAQIVLRRLADAIRPEDVTGRIIIAPSINFPASETGKRLSPIDGQNMNRVFPGNPQGTPTEKLAAFATGSLFPAVDLLIDVHAGGRDVSVVPMVFGFTTPTSKVGEPALTALMEAWGYDFVQHVEGIRETACGAAKEMNLASIEVEGGGGRMKTSELEIMEAGLRRGLAHYGALAGAVAPTRFAGVHVTAGPEGQYVADAPGLVEHRVALGARVGADDVVALVHPVAGADPTPRAIRAPTPGYVLRQTEHAYVARGQLIGNLGAPLR